MGMLNWFKAVGTKLSTLGALPYPSELVVRDRFKLVREPVGFEELKWQLAQFYRVPLDNMKVENVFYEDGRMVAKVRYNIGEALFSCEVELE